jgi:hypothetical protein
MIKDRLTLLSSVDLPGVIQSEGVHELILYFSCGKDSIAAWLYLRQFKFNILPVYLYTVPGLRSDAENLTYYENYFGQHIMRFPHPLLYGMLNNLVYQPPERVAQIWACDIPDYSFFDLDTVISKNYKLGAYYAAMGMRMADNLERRMMMYQNGVLGSKNRRFYYPIWDWNIKQVSEIIINNKVKLPRAYSFMGRTIAAIDYYYIAPFRREYPDDYERILNWFPLLEAEFFRYERLSNEQ